MSPPPVVSPGLEAPATPRSLKADLSAGLVVFLVALPLCLGIALASNAPLFSGIVSGIVGGLIVGALSGSHTSVSGPAAGLTAVVAAQILSLGSFDAFLVAVVLAGVLQIFLGFAKAGAIADFVPNNVIRGLLGAIGLILILKQIPHLLGYDADPIGEMAFDQPDHENTFTELLHLSSHIHVGASLIGFLSIALLQLWEHTKALKSSPVPGPLVVVLFGVCLNEILPLVADGLRVEPSHLVQVPVAESISSFLGFLQFPDLAALGNPKVYVAAGTIAIVASLETLLNLEAVDRIDPQRRTSPPDRELIAQGVGNVVSGAIGGLPLTSVIVRSSVNINSGARSKASAIVHGSLLLLCVALLPEWLNRIPLSALAAVLIMTGYKLASPKLFKDMWAAGTEQFVPFVLTVAAILATDLLIGILIGLGFSIFFILRSNLRRPLNRMLEHHLHGDVLRIELANQVSFLNRAALRTALDEAPVGGHVLIDATSTDYIDADVLAVIRDYESEIAPARQVSVSLLGFKPHYERIEDQVRFVDLATRDLQERLTPREVIRLLEQGNERFRNGQPLSRNITQLRRGVEAARHPLAVILSGSSSRTPLEMIFDAGMGELFCTRTTGNVAHNAVLASLEYGCVVAGAKAILVLAHTDNKAVRMAMENVADPPLAADSHLERVLAEIRDSADDETRASFATGDDLERQAIVDLVSKRHAQQTAARILRESSSLRALAEAGRLHVGAAIYDLNSGAVEFLD